MKYLIMLLTIFVISCETPEERSSRLKKISVEELTTDFQYIKDSRTGLCFAAYNVGFNNGQLVNVPCSSEVEKASVIIK